MKVTRRTTITGLAGAVLVALGIPITPTSATTNQAPPTEPVPTEIRVDLPVPTTPEAALAIPLGSGVEAVGFRFEQPGIVGEYFPQSKSDLENFTSSFRSDYGVAPAVVSLVIDTSTGSAAKLDVSGIVSRAELPRVEPLSATSPAVVERFEASRARAAEASAASAASKSPNAIMAIGPKSWAPGYTEVYAAPQSGKAKIYTYNSWYNGGADQRNPHFLDSDWGIEIDIVQRNATVTPIPGAIYPSRPNCNPATSFRNQFWAARSASNSAPFTGWTVEYIALGQSVTPASIGAYADGDDLFDECGNQSMSIGIGHPNNISGAGGGFYDIATSIYTPLGTQTISPVSGSIQAVSNDCNNIGSSPASSCMGLNYQRDLPGQDESQIILNLSRGWVLPKCWSVNYPEAPFSFSCGI